MKTAITTLFLIMLTHQAHAADPATFADITPQTTTHANPRTRYGRNPVRPGEPSRRSP